MREVAEVSNKGAAVNIIFGLALGNLSTVVPVFALAATIFFSHLFCNMYGVSLAAIGMLSTLPAALAIDAYGPICDNAGGIAEMGRLGEKVSAI